MRALVALLFLSGCAVPVPLDVSSREPVCARRCLEVQAACISRAGIAADRIAASNVLQACRENTGQCLSTCPAK